MNIIESLMSAVPVITSSGLEAWSHSAGSVGGEMFDPFKMFFQKPKVQTSAIA